MKIALISFEYVGFAAAGGIGVYTRNAARMLAARGHSVEVFTSGERSGSHPLASGLVVHTIRSSRPEFAADAVTAFAERHAMRRFDVVEGPEYQANAAGVAAAFPQLPLVVKLHGPTFSIDASNGRHVSPLAKARFLAGGIRRGRLHRNPWRYESANDPERRLALQADEVVANSNATADLVSQAWGIPRARIATVALPFDPEPELLGVDAESETRTVLFLGRLEVRKGVIELARAIPMVLRRAPDTRFRFIGRVLPHPQDGAPVAAHMGRHLAGYEDSVEFVDEIPYDDVPAELAASDICVFPSDWEASGFVCLEAMAAARGVVGSAAGGMSEIIENGRTGLLVPPRDPTAIAAAILRLLRDPKKRARMGRLARNHVRRAYRADVIAPLQEQTYRRSIDRARARGKNATAA